MDERFLSDAFLVAMETKGWSRKVGAMLGCASRIYNWSKNDTAGVTEIRNVQSDKIEELKGNVGPFMQDALTINV